MKRFNEFHLDAANECLWRGSTRLSLTRKAFAVLNCLVEETGRIVTKSELMDRVWPGVYVGEENLKVYIRELRALLGDQAGKPTYIETHRDRGYSFIAPVAEGAAPGSERDLESESLCGRAIELARLHQGFKEACLGNRQIIFITGEPGIGKTSIVESFLSRLTGHLELRVGVGQCIESYHEQEAFYPVLEAFGRLLRDPAGDEFAQLLARQAPTWLVQFPAAANAMGRLVVQSEILGAGRERMLREICEGLERLTERTPLILVLEDLHWSDHSTLDFIAAVARRREPARLMLMATYRPVEVIVSDHPLRRLKSELTVHGQATELPIEFLPESAVSEYLATRFSGSIAELLAGEVHQKTNGNPLFIVALMDHLVSQQMVVESDNTWSLQGTVEQIRSIVPQSLLETIQKQIEHLAPAEQDLLTAASVIGVSFSAALVAAGLDCDSSMAEELCDSLSRRHLMLRRGGLEDLPDGEVSGLFQFTHWLHRDALYTQCSPVTRVKLHRRIGESIEKLWSGRENEMAAELTRHFQEARDYSRVVRYLRLQAENARHRYAYRDAVALLEMGIQFAAKLSDRAHSTTEIEVLTQLAGVYDDLGDKAQAARLYETAAKRAAALNQSQAEVESLLGLSRELSFGDTPRALQVAERAVQQCDQVDNPALRVSAETWANFLRLAWDGWEQNLANEHQERVEWLRRAGESDLMAQQAFGLAVLQVFTGDHEGALRTASEALPLLANRGDALGHFTIHWMQCWALLNLGQGGESLRGLRKALALAERNGSAFDTAIGQMFLAELHCEAFDPGGVRSLCDEALMVIRQSGSAFAMQRALITSAVAHMNSGGRDRASAYLSELSQLYAGSGIGLSWYWKMPLQCALSEQWLAADNTTAARAEVDRLRALADRNINRGWQARARQISARVSLAESDFDRAEREIDDALALIRNHKVPLVAWRVHETASAFCAITGSAARAVDHAQTRNEILLRFADSFEDCETLRRSVRHFIEPDSTDSK